MNAPVPTESAVVKAGADYLSRLGWTVRRHNVGAQKITEASGKVRFIRYGKKGESDLRGFCPWGLYVAAEAKRPSGENKLSDDQLLYLRRVRQARCIAIVFGSLDELEVSVEIAQLTARYFAPFEFLRHKIPESILRLSNDACTARLSDLTSRRNQLERRYLPRGENAI